MSLALKRVLMLIPLIAFFAGCLPVVTERPRVLTTAGMRHFNPSFSPDGKSILFEADIEGNAEVFVSNPDGSEMRNLTGNPAGDTNPVWSPGGNYILFTTDRDGQKEIYRMLPDGTGLINLTRNPADDDYAGWSPDGGSIIFFRGTPVYSVIDGKKYLSGHKDTLIAVASSEGISQRILARDGDMPRWSPDGKWVLYRKNLEMRLIRPDGSYDHGLAWGTPVAWTSDSNAVFYSPLRRGVERPGHIHLINIDGSGDKMVIENSGIGGNWLHVDSRRFWDPSGLRIALAVNHVIGKNGKNGIVVMGPQGEVIADYRGKGYEYDAPVSWSPDGKGIVFSMHTLFPWSGGIYTMNADGTGRKQIIEDKGVR